MKAKKALGQNFFSNKNLCIKICDIVTENNPDILVEIGPGRGSFTSFLETKIQEMILIEKDSELASNLSNSFSKSTIITSDFLDWDLKELEKHKDEKIVFFGSLPYNASKPIIRKIIQSKYFNQTCYFIIQKEVAEKYIAREPENNYLSLETQLFADTKRILNISPGSFRPKPKVQSSFVSFSPKEELKNIDTFAFIKFLKTCFKQPKKTLRNNLKPLNFEKDKGLDELLSKRPQHLSLNEYICLFDHCH